MVRIKIIVILQHSTMVNDMCQTSDLLVMVVDPDKNELQKSCDSLNRLGITKIICVETYNQAIESLRESGDVDIVIADFVLEPTKPLGMLLCGAVKREHPGILFILVSKEYSCSVVLESLPLADDILDKNRENEIEELMGKWIKLAKLKNTTREILHGSKYQ